MIPSHPEASGRSDRSVRAAVLTGAAALGLLVGGGALALDDGPSSGLGRPWTAQATTPAAGDRDCPWRKGEQSATLLGFAAGQTNQASPVARAADDLPVADVAERANPAVVTVTTLDDAFGGEASPVGAGSGFIVDAEGHVVTNSHVVANAAELTVTFLDGTRVPASVVGRDEVQDIAVLQLDLSGGDEVPGILAFGDSTAVRAGERVVAIGSSLGELTNTVSDGTVGAVDRDLAVYSGLLQHDAEIYPGNSGGPLLNLRGEVVGVNVAGVGGFGGDRTAQIAPARIGFALDGNDVREVVDELIANGVVRRPYLGIVGGAGADGHEVVEVEAGDPAAEAGLEAGDVITAIDGEEIGGRTTLADLLYEREPGETVTLSVERDGAEREIEVTLGERNEATE